MTQQQPILRSTTVRLAAVMVIAILGLANVATARTAPEIEQLDDSLGYGYHLKTGKLAIEAGRVFVHCKDQAILVVNAELAEVALELLDASDGGNGRWKVDGEIIDVQFAKSVFASKKRNQGEAFADKGLPAVELSDLLVAKVPANGSCRSIWQGYKCANGPFRCPNGCFTGFKFESQKNWWTCLYTGNPFDFCAEQFQPVCKLVEYTCADCTGPVVNSWPINVSACVVLP